MNDINQLLYRKIKDGKQYNKYFPKTTCKSTFLGTGMTEFSVKEMASMVNSYAWQTAELAPLLKQQSLQATCNAIHDFTYWHFQYHADKADQLLRSPACSWYSRAEGIDCKSYSILASCILINLGISHYIRRIKQPGTMADLFTHVYIVVPVDQKKGSLDKGSYIIDGTILETTEPLYIEKSDLFMSMNHYGLNGSLPQRQLQRYPLYQQQGLNGFSLNDLKNKWRDIFAGKFDLSCINGSLNMSHFNTTMNNVVAAFDVMFANVNESIKNTDPNLINNVNKVLRTAGQLYWHSRKKFEGDWKSGCSKDAVRAYETLGRYYNSIAFYAFLPWLKTYFDTTSYAASGPNNTFDIQIAFDKNSDVATVNYEQLTAIATKPTTTQIPKFEITQFIMDSSQTGQPIDIVKALLGLNSIIVAIAPNKAGTGTPGTSSGGSVVIANPMETQGKSIDPSTGKPITKIPKIQEAGMGTIVGAIVATAGVAMLLKGDTATGGATKTAKAKKTTATTKTTSKKAKNGKRS